MNGVHGAGHTCPLLTLLRQAAAGSPAPTERQEEEEK